MKLLQKSIDRRRLLQNLGYGGAFFLPFLRSWEAQGQSASPKRVLFVFLQHGWGREYGDNDVIPVSFDASSLNQSGDLQWTDQFSFLPNRELAPLESIKSYVTLLDGVRNCSYWGNAHDVSYSEILTATTYHGERGSPELGAQFPMPSGESFDHYLASQLGTHALRISHRYRSWGRSYHPLCFERTRSGQIIELPQFTSAYDAFQSLSGLTAQSADDRVRRGSVLSAQKDDIQRLMARLPAEARPKLEEYLNRIETLETRLGSLGFENLVLPAEPSSNLSFDPGFDAALELVKATFASNTHNVAVLGLGESTQADAFGKHASQADFHHYVAHYTPNTPSRDEFVAWVQAYASKIAGFAQDLATTDDIDGQNMLDNTMIVLLGEVGDGQHNRRKLAVPIIGGRSLGLQTGRTWLLPTFAPRNRGGFFWGAPLRSGGQHESEINYGRDLSLYTHADLWTTLGQKFGMTINSWGHQEYNYGALAI